MKLRLAFILLLFVSAQLFSLTKYYIYFKDKGVPSGTKLSKTSAQYITAEKELSVAAIERRKQVMGDEYITFEDLPISASYISQLESSGIKIENKLKWFNAVTTYLTDEQAQAVASLPFVSKLEIVNATKLVEPVEIKNPSLQKSSSISSPTGLDYGVSLRQNLLSDVPTVHDLGITGKGVLIGMLDTGFRWKTHPALKNLKIIAEKDFIQKDEVTENQTGDASNQDSHGTNCLGLMSGFDPGKLIGPAYEATILLAKTEYVPSETLAEEDNYAAALEWMEAKGVQITTSSLGYNQFDGGVGDYPWSSFDGKTTITAKALNLAFDRGVTTLTAAGNERANSWGKLITPADALNVIAVGAVDLTNRIASFSSPGPTSDGRIKPEVVAMGVLDYVSTPNGSYSTGSGTSYATPIAAGIAGLLKSAWPHLTNQQIRKIFLECGDNASSPNNDRGWGLISASRVISYPNLSRFNGYFRLNKIFLEPTKIDHASVLLTYKIGSSSYRGTNMQINGDIKYSYLFPDLEDNSSIDFYFTYKKDGVEVREPAVGSYKINELSNVGNEGGELPTTIRLYQNYPNPFNSSTTIRYELTDFGHVKLNLINILGQKISTIVDQVQSPGLHQYKLNTEDLSLSSGVYLYSLNVGNSVVTKKMLLIK